MSRASFMLAALLAPAAAFAATAAGAGYWAALVADIVAVRLIGGGNVAGAVALLALARLAALWWFARGAPRPGGARPALRLVALGVYAAAMLLQIAVVASDEARAALGRFPSMPSLIRSVSMGIDGAIDWLTRHFAPFFSGLTYAMNVLLSTLESALAATPWPVAMLALAFLAWQRAGRGAAVLTACALVYVGLFGFWEKTATTAALVIAALFVCILFGIPLGVAAAKSRPVRAVLMPCLDVMQTMPSFVYLLPAVAFFSIGKPPALVATVIFAMPPLIRLTCLGIEQVPLAVREAMYAHGATPLQTLVKAELPLAGPSIHAGVNQTIMMSLSMVVIAALIGGGGLGYDVLFALQNVQYGRGILSGSAIVLCAIIFDRLVRSSAGK